MTSWFVPTTQTKFRIDQEWWEQSGRDFRLYLRDQLCPGCQQRFPDHRNTEMVDWVDPETGEVQRADALWQCLTTMCANEPDYIHPHMPLVAAIFRALLKSGNKPLSPQELHDQYVPWKMPDVILRTLAGGKVHLGIRPVERD